MRLDFTAKWRTQRRALFVGCDPFEPAEGERTGGLQRAELGLGVLGGGLPVRAEHRV